MRRSLCFGPPRVCSSTAAESPSRANIRVFSSINLTERFESSAMGFSPRALSTKTSPSELARQANDDAHQPFANPHHSTTAPSSSRIVVALSGGVDSSIAAALLLEQIGQNRNHVAKLEAVHMTNWNRQDEDAMTESSALEDPVCYEQEWKDAQAVASHLGLNIRRCHLESEYWTKVFQPYLDALLGGDSGRAGSPNTNILESTLPRMGNPDVDCNARIKFGALKQHPVVLDDKFHGISHPWLATGHYARLWYPSWMIENSSTSISWLPPPIPLIDYQNEVEASLKSDQDEWLWDTWVERPDMNQAYPCPLLLAARDRAKDQSYFLATCSAHDQLQHVLFPLGDLYKNSPRSQNDDVATGHPVTVRQLALELGLPTAQKPDSMGICFVGPRRRGWQAFVRDYLDPQTMLDHVEFVCIDTYEVVGKTREASHPALFTAGQGARVGGRAQKYFVVGPSSSTIIPALQDMSLQQPNQVLVCAGTHHPALFSDWFTVEDMHWVGGEPLWSKLGDNLNANYTFRCQCRIRHLQPLVDCLVEVIPTHSNSSASSRFTYRIHAERPLRAIMRGQVAVLYVGVVCLGGGAIAGRGPSYFEQGKPLPPLENLHPSGANDHSAVGAQNVDSRGNRSFQVGTG